MTSIPGSCSNSVSIPITVVRTEVYSRRFVSREFRSDLLRFANQISVVFKGRHSRKFLLTWSVQQARRLDPIFRHSTRRTRNTRKRKKGTRLERRRPGRKLDCPLPSAPVPCVSAVSRVLSPFPPQHWLSSCSRNHAISSVFFPLRAILFLSSCDRLHTVCRINRKETRNGEKAPVENCRAMKRTSRPTLYRY